MISVKELRDLHPDIWASLNYIFSGTSNVPCLFATASFKKEIMQFTVVDKKSELMKILSADLISFSNKLQEAKDLAEKTYSTLIVVCRENFENESEEYNFIDNMLIDLHLKDPIEWPDDKTKDTNNQEFEFYWNGLPWFPILLHRSHREKIRKSNFLIIGFQSGIVFKFNKEERSVFYERMRHSIHSKIANFYPEELPFYLSNKSSGRNICQYSGFDKGEHLSGYKYPILS